MICVNTLLLVTICYAETLMPEQHLILISYSMPTMINLSKMNTHRPILHLIMLNYKILIKQIVLAIKELHGLVEIYFISVNNIYWINCMSYNNITYIGIRKQVTQHLYKIFSQIPKKKRKENTCKMVRTCTLIIHTFV